jgi:hypothetical protein
MPDGLLVTVPEPSPLLLTVSVLVATLALNVAVTDWFPIIGTIQDPANVQAPLQPPNVEPAAGAAVSVTTLPTV